MYENIPLVLFVFFIIFVSRNSKVILPQCGESFTSYKRLVWLCERSYIAFREKSASAELKSTYTNTEHVLARLYISHILGMSEKQNTETTIPNLAYPVFCMLSGRAAL